MTTTWQRLADALVDAVAPALPDGFQARLDVENGGIAFERPGVPHIRVGVGVQPLVEQPGEVDRRLASACWSVLSAAQDLVAEGTGEPWPGRGTELPLPGVEVLEHEVRLWYGPRASPALVLAPIPR
ncbi:MAG: hypothetical protein JJT89_03640 [Nitriliruptoraceae bacterium]|nr:hypothetical protein [Nitriliruptoraceae bacterium]